MKTTKKTEAVRAADNNITELVFILDRSGSMSGLESDTIGGFNAMIRKQKEQEGKAYVTTVLFDSKPETLHDRVDLANVPEMTDKEYAVGGCTALLDAIGETVHHIEEIHRYVRPEDVPGKTMVVITTDGMENASREYSLSAVKKCVESKQKKGWEFLFLGANIDAISTARSFGIREDRAANYHCDAKGVEKNYEVLACAVSDFRAGKALGKQWKEEIDKDFEERS